MPHDLARAAAVLVLVLGAAGDAGAAEARIGLTFGPLPPIPPGAEARLDGNLTYSYDAASPNATRIWLLLDQPGAWLAATLGPAVVSVPANGTGNRSVVPLSVTLSVAPDAPALARQTLVLHASAEANVPLDPAQAAASLQVEVAFVGKLRVEAGRVPPQRPGDPFNVPVDVTNLGNGAVRVTLDANASTPHLQVVAPAPFLVDRNETRTVNVSVLADAPGEATLMVRYGSAYAYDASLIGPSDVLTVPVQATQSQFLPGFEPLLGMVALVLLAAARRR